VYLKIKSGTVGVFDTLDTIQKNQSENVDARRLRLLAEFFSLAAVAAKITGFSRYTMSCSNLMRNCP